MEVPVWNEKYSVGIDQIDQHHQDLVAITGKAFAAFHSGTLRTELPALMDQLTDYATYHFTCEEGWMNKALYPCLSKHKKEHDEFIGRLKIVQTDAVAGRPVTLEVIIFLDRWIREHVLHSDKQFGIFMLGKMGAATPRIASSF